MKLCLTEGMRAALPVLNLLQNQGYEAVFVGGAVRDLLLERPVNDIDIATSARPEEVMKLFPKCIPTGLQHGTVTVLLEGASYEITTFRREAAYEHYRKPSEVSFIRDLDGDLLRRDFTMNAMAAQADGTLYDPYQGRGDLLAKKLRCVGAAETRFQEDALRMLRAIRFIGSYRLTPALSAWRALRKHRPLLKFIAMERVEAELSKMLESDETLRGLTWLAASRLLEHTKEPIFDRKSLSKLLYWQRRRAYPYRKRDGDIEANRFAMLNELSQGEDKLVCMILLLELDESATIRIAEALRFSKGRKAFLLSVWRIHESMLKTNGEAEEALNERWRECVLRFGEEACLVWLRLFPIVKGKIDTETSEYSIGRFGSMLEQMPIKQLKELNVNGSELSNFLGRPAGPWMKALLQTLLRMAASGRLPNEKIALLTFAEKWNEQKQGEDNDE
ncbi:CCA tRNA nucleotidyltransferase [Paenibacillus sp. HB172176]|uniref:CCA tRNA nucleotidyltransferase n=1 Tax=Paenibacillus sp. HB172176 TaxID=2493690 RepID=UPI00143C2460|nr:CCA tRNA nucleotidyltransferase [Paenibacillus sp. HB172176]